MPGSRTSTKLAVKQEVTETKSKQNRENESGEPSSLDKVMTEFQNTCALYTALGHSITGLKHIEVGNMSAAVLNLLEASRLGHTSSQFNLGLCYEIGAGVEQDLDKAKEFYELAGEADHADAIYNLALLETDEKKMIELLTKSADLGLARAQTYLGVYYIESEDVEDQKKAVQYFTSAAEQNESEAQCFLGMCYERGLGGMEVNECKAADLYHKSAQTGNDTALYNLAVFHEYGLGGIPQDRVSAMELYEKAARAGNVNAQLQLDEMKAREAEEEWKVLYEDQDGERKTILTTNGGGLSPSVSSPSITDYVRKHLVELTFTENLFVDDCTEDRNQKVDKKTVNHRAKRAQFSLGEDEDWDEQGYLSERQNGLLKLSSISPNCSIMGMSRNSTMPELGYIPCP